MRFGIFTSMGGQTWAGVLDLWKHLETTRWDIACVTDHFMPNTKEREGAMLESWSTLSALAALVPRLRIGTIVLGNTYRHPAVVAKMAAPLFRKRLHWAPAIAILAFIGVALMQWPLPLVFVVLAPVSITLAWVKP